MKKDFAWHIRDMLGVRVQWLGTHPVRLRAWPIGLDWQGWYSKGRTKDQAYETMVRNLCRVPAFTHLRGRADEIISKAYEKAEKEDRSWVLTTSRKTENNFFYAPLDVGVT